MKKILIARKLIKSSKLNLSMLRITDIQKIQYNSTY